MVKSYEIVAPLSYSLGTCWVKISKKKNENSVKRELPKIAILLKKSQLVL